MLIPIVQLALSFAKIGILTIGGGMVMLPLISAEMLKRGWMDDMEFINILGISEATPGPMALNCATFVGWKVEGLAGSAVATISLAIPAFFCVMIFGFIWRRYRDHPGTARLMRFLRVVMAGLILTLALQIGSQVMGAIPGGAGAKQTLWQLPLMAAVGVSVVRGKISPVTALLGGAVVGAALSLV